MNTSEDLALETSPRTRGLFLKNLAEFQTELARINAGFVPALSVWRHRREFPAFVFRSMRRVQDLRNRCRELGVLLPEMHHSTTVAGRALLDQLCSAPSPAGYLQAACVVVNQVLIAAIDEDLKRYESVYDLPSAPLLRADREELDEERQWAENAIAEMARVDGNKPDPEFVERIQALSGGLAALLREHNVRGGELVRTGRRMGSLPLAKATLPAGFTDLEFGLNPLPAGADYDERARFHAVNFLQEVQAADSCASILFDAPDMPWEFYLDLSRHLWDESRHAMFGEKKLADIGCTAEEAGLSSIAYVLRQTLAPIDRYAVLSTQEADAFPGKHVGLKDALAHGDSISAMMWSYDIADETQHVRFGHKWIPVMIEKTGEARSYEQVRQDACNWRASVLAKVYKPAAAALR